MNAKLTAVAGLVLFLALVAACGTQTATPIDINAVASETAAYFATNATPTPTLTPTDTPTPPTESPTPGPSPTATETPTATFTYTATPTFTISPTFDPLSSATATFTPSLTYTPSVTPTPTATTTGPVISQVRPASSFIYASQPVGCTPTTTFISADVTDSVALSSVSLLISVGGNTSTLPMTLVAGNTWQVQVGPTTNVVVVSYRVSAVNTQGQSVVSPEQFLQVSPCNIPPTPTWTVTPSITPTPPPTATPTPTATSTCGNLICDAGETAATCADCAGVCGDGVCNGNLESWLTCSDCTAPVCGDGVCADSEIPALCPGDCLSCGDSFCDVAAGESNATCAADCPADCGDAVCDANEGFLTCGDCAPPVCGDGTCEFPENPSTCAADCSAYCGDGFCSVPGESAGAGACWQDCNNCGDGTCSAGETDDNCPADCGSMPQCGNNTCDSGESPAICPSDCDDGCGGDGLCTANENAATCNIGSGGSCPDVCGDGLCTLGETGATCPPNATPPAATARATPARTREPALSTARKQGDAAARRPPGYDLLVAISRTYSPKSGLKICCFPSPPALSSRFCASPAMTLS
ncbi:MAG: hypothetical protein M5R40_17585 [Anaerolineae bacterium]|nr:hypothetical protein [Anaerolineae bacterium]